MLKMQGGSSKHKKRMGSDTEELRCDAKRIAIDLTEEKKDETQGSGLPPSISDNNASRTEHNEEDSSSSSDESIPCVRVENCPNCGSDDFEWAGRCKSGGHRCCTRCLKACPSCDRVEETDEDDFQNTDALQPCPVCHDDMYYTGQKCDDCEELICFHCIEDSDDAICTGCILALEVSYRLIR